MTRTAPSGPCFTKLQPGTGRLGLRRLLGVFPATPFPRWVREDLGDLCRTTRALPWACEFASWVARIQWLGLSLAEKGVRTICDLADPIVRSRSKRRGCAGPFNQGKPPGEFEPFRLEKTAGATLSLLPLRARRSSVCVRFLEIFIF